MEDARSRAVRRAQLALLGLGALGLLVYVVRILRIAGSEFNELADTWLYNALIILPAVVCLLRAVVAPETRAVWIAFGVGLIFNAAGDIYWTIAFADVEKIPYPSPADVFYLATIPCFFAGIALLTKRAGGHFAAASWLDGAIGGLAAAAAGTAAIAPALVGLTKGDAAAVVTNLAYPLGDVLLLAFVVAAVLALGRRSAAPFLLIGAGLVAWAVADAIYLVTEATSSYRVGWLDLLWPIGALLLASASTVSAPVARRRADARSPILLPAVFAAIALGILTVDHFERVHAAAVLLSVATLVAVIVRLALSFRENDALVESLRRETVTDALTGLGNRRELFARLERIVGRGGEEHRVLAILDLDGFKQYNDTFGHPAGDALLCRLGAKLRETVDGHGSAYRLGGDEFAVLIKANPRTAEAIVEAARGALAEQGEGFAIGASCGSVVVSQPGLSASVAMRVADKAMYEEKASRKGRLETQTRDVLLRVLREREPLLSDHVHDVAALARAVGGALELGSEQMDVLVRAAELHDIGKIAIPEEILHKPGPLDELEWSLMHKHTLIGERILGAAPAMAPIAAAVRSSHERWDGRGYPDGLAGEQIPLEARIVFVCDAYDAMRTDRPYREAVSREDALAELRRNAGGQFDPRIVEVFCSVVPQDDGTVAGGDAAPDPQARRVTLERPS